MHGRVSEAYRHSRALVLALLLASAGDALWAQVTCEGTLAGRVVDEHDGESLAAASVYLVGAGVGAYADAAGEFRLEGLCPGPDTLRVTHVGCAPVTRAVVVGSASAKTLRVELEHHAEVLAAAEVHAHRNLTSASDVGGTLAGEQLDRTAGEDFADVVDALPGVRQLVTGANIGRPLVDGLGGSRLAVVQGGVTLATQDWGDEHALEIDPFDAANVQLARGGGTVRYGAATTGATLVLDDPTIPTNRRVAGRALALARSNARAVGAGLSAAQALGRHWGYRASATVADAGDAEAPDYVLSNTGAERRSAKARVYYADTALRFDLGYRYFYQEAGVLRAAHIGNLTDLREALASGEPRVVRPRTRVIDAPRTTATHHWLTANAAYALARGSELRLTYSAQLNERREYDIRRGGRSARPTIDLGLETHDVRAEYVPAPGPTWSGSIGAQATTADNRNRPGTGAAPFIPHYDAETVGLFAQASRVSASGRALEFSGRLDHRATLAQYFEGFGDSRTLERFRRSEWFGAASVGLASYGDAGWSKRARLTVSSRTPNPAERFADGVHHALAVVEVGDTTLRVERGAKLLGGLGYETEGARPFAIHLAAYAQVFDGFIYQQPQAAPRLTVRGAFPVFAYRQADALLSGVDLDAHVSLTRGLQLDAEAAYTYGALFDGDATPLPDIAPLRGRLEFSYTRTTTRRLKDWRVAAYGITVAEANRPPATLPAPPPPGYALLGLELGGHVAVGRRQAIGVHVTVHNLLGARTRDYLDRLRFYADQPGRDVRLRLLYDF